MQRACLEYSGFIQGGLHLFGDEPSKMIELKVNAGAIKSLKILCAVVNANDRPRIEVASPQLWWPDVRWCCGQRSKHSSRNRRSGARARRVQARRPRAPRRGSKLPVQSTLALPPVLAQATQRPVGPKAERSPPGKDSFPGRESQDTVLTSAPLRRCHFPARFGMMSIAGAGSRAAWYSPAFA